MISVMLADDQALIRTALAALVGNEEGFSIAGEAADGVEAVALALTVMPDVVLMDIRMPRMDGIEATARICAEPALSATRVMILTTFEEDEFVLQALRAGASGFMGKGTEALDLMNAIRTIHQGESLLSPRATKALISRYVNPPPAVRTEEPALFRVLTEREREILRLVGKGLSNQAIADQLFISPATAKTHVNRIMSKLAAHDRAQLVIAAYESGMLTPGEP